MYIYIYVLYIYIYIYIYITKKTYIYMSYIENPIQKHK